jgi:hypothetical protein
MDLFNLTTRSQQQVGAAGDWATARNPCGSYRRLSRRVSLHNLDSGEVMEEVMCCNHCGGALDHLNVRVEPPLVPVLR